MAFDSPTPDSSGGGEVTPAEDDKDLHKEAIERFKLSMEAWSQNRKDSLEDTKFRNLEQWPEKIKAQREKDGRPCLVVDKGNQYVRQVVNDGRQNRPAIKIHAADDEAHVDAAEAFQDIIRSICVRSNADAAYDTALDHAATGGFGFFRITTKYIRENTFNQDICIKRVRNPLAVLLDPNIQEADGSDANWGFVIDELPKKQFKKQYPKAKFVDWESDSKKYSDDWMTGENVRICEYFYKVETPTDLHLLADGSSVEDDEYQRAIKELGQDKVPEIIETRTIPTCKVKWCRMSGAEILEENDWLGKYIPIIPVFGNELDVDGKVVYSGLIRGAKDAMRLYNYMRSHFAENVALSSKAPYVAAAGQVEGHPEWSSLNNDPVSVAVYDPIDVNGTALPPPRREPPPAIPEAYSRDMQMSEHDIQTSMGMFAASLGEPSNEKSGRAINARVRESDTGTFHYHDNQARALCYLGVQLVDLIPKVIDSARAVQLMGEDGVTSIAHIDPSQSEAVSKQGAKTIYNLSVGTYGVTVATGPSYTTKRQEASEGMIALTQANPSMWQTHGDLIVKAQDWPNADDFAKRSKMALPPSIAQQVQQEEQANGAQNPEVLAAIAPLQQGLQQAHQQIQQAEAGIQERDQAMAELQQKLNAAKSSDEANQLKSQIEQAKIEQANAQIQLERDKMAVEERQFVLGEETKLRVAQISAGMAPETPEETQSRVAQEGTTMEQLAQVITSSHQQMMDMMQQHAGAIGQLAQTLANPRPRTIQRGPDGAIIGIQ